MVKEAIIIHVPSKPITQFCHIFLLFPLSLNPSPPVPVYGKQYNRRLRESEYLSFWYIRAILIPQPLVFYLKKDS